MATTCGSFVSSILAMTLLVLTTRVDAQCATIWQPTPAYPGANDYVAASIEWDPDGPGPRSPVAALAGAFTAIGTTTTRGVVTFDPASGSWESLEGLGGRVSALAVLPNGELLAGGSFTVASGAPVNNIARWNGSAWLPLGAGLELIDFPFEAVTSLAVMPSGEVVAAGDFTMAGGVSARHIAQWNGSTWSPLGQGLGGPPFGGSTPHCMLVLPNGDLVVGGEFATAGGVSASRIAIWNGVSWSAMGSGVGGIAVTSLRLLANGDLVAGGLFPSIGGVLANNVARWNGSSWAPLGAGTGGLVRTIAALPNGDLLAGGDFVTAGGVGANRVARWNGVAWSAIGAGFDGPTLTLLPLQSGAVVAGGYFRVADGQPALNAARWDGASWFPLEQGIAGSSLNAVLALPAGEAIVGGAFAITGVAGAPNIAQWDGLAWSPLGAGTDAPVHALVRLPNGDVVAGGAFASAGGVAANRVARWNGVAWSSMSAPLLQTVYALAVLPNGDLVAGGAFPGVLRFDGSTWSALGSTSGDVTALAVLPNGELVAGGAFLTAGGSAVNGVARWDGATWQPFGSGVLPSYGGEAVLALAVLSNGDLVCGGTFPGRIARWNGTNWSWPGPLPDDWVTALTMLPDGDLVASGRFGYLGALEARGLARWDGAAWSAMDYAYPHEPAAAATMLASGDLLLCANGLFGSRVRRLATTCRATTTVGGAGCTGSGGANVLTAQSLPWIGSVHRSKASGMPTNGFAFVVLGFGAVAIPIVSLVPQGGSGCDLLATIDAVDTRPLVAGSVALAIPIPDSIAFVGLTVHQQVLPVELDSAGNLVSFTATNSLVVTIGAF